MSRIAKIILGLVLFFVVIYGWRLSDNLSNQKATYAAMQGVEAMYREKSLPVPFILEKNGLLLVAVAAENNNFPYVWILLNKINAGDPDGLYKVGSGRPKKMRCSEIDSILNMSEVSKEARVFLQSNCFREDSR